MFRSTYVTSIVSTVRDWVKSLDFDCLRRDILEIWVIMVPFARIIPIPNFGLKYSELKESELRLRGSLSLCCA
jgi:hypothetical protein